MSASEARRRLEAFRKKQQAAAAAKQQPADTAGAAPAPSGEAEAAAAAAAASVSFEGAISEAFEDSLKYYVAEEQKEVGLLCLISLHEALELCGSHLVESVMLPAGHCPRWCLHEQPCSKFQPDLLCCICSNTAILPGLQLLKHLDGLIREEAERLWKPPEGQESSRVLGSANQLFLKIRASLNRCVKLVSRGNTLLRLSGAFKVCYSTRMLLPAALWHAVTCLSTFTLATLQAVRESCGLQWYCSLMHLSCVCGMCAACAVHLCWRATEAAAQNCSWRHLSTASVQRH